MRPPHSSNDKHSYYREFFMAHLANWSNAPTWARWYAIDSDGAATYFERKPQRAGDCWCMGGKEESAGRRSIGQNWRDAIEQRPSARR